MTGLPADLRWTTDRPMPLRQPLRPCPRWLNWLPDWLRHVVSWRMLRWIDSRYQTCWVELVGWKLNGEASDRNFAVGESCHRDARKCQLCYCNKLERR